MSIAFGQKGRCEMKLFEIPILVTSLFGLCLLSGLDTQTAYADFTFGERVNLRSAIPVLDAPYFVECLSYDGLEMYIDRGFGGGNGDLYVLKRASVDNDWGPPVNLGPTVNSSQEDVLASISADGLTLYFHSNRPGGYSCRSNRCNLPDIWRRYD
jgi:hypothetical protein